MKRRLYVNVQPEIFAEAERAIEAKSKEDGIKTTMTQFVEAAMRSKSREILDRIGGQ